MKSLIPLLGFLRGCRTLEPYYPKTWVDELSFLSSSLSHYWTSDLGSYSEAFPLKKSRLYARSLSSGNYKLALYRIGEVNDEAIGDILLVHGYMAHSGHLLKVGEELSLLNWRVFLVDLPGHGLSTGERFSISDFREYGQAVADSWKALRSTNSTGFMIGHSTGGSSIIESLSLLQEDLPRGLVLGAPLLELQRRGFRTTLNSLAGNRTIKLPEIFRNPRFMSRGASQNPQFRDFALLGDPLYCWIYSPPWLSAYDSWAQRTLTPKERVFDGPVLVLQGQKDSVIEWNKNEKLLPLVFVSPVIRSFPTFTHTIFNLVPREMDVIMSYIREFMREVQKSEDK